MALRWIPKEDAEELGLIGVPIRAYLQTADREKPFYSRVVVIPAGAWDEGNALGQSRTGSGLFSQAGSRRA
jgi:hypothetical protein